MPIRITITHRLHSRHRGSRLIALHRILTSHSRPRVTALRRRILMGHRLRKILMSNPHNRVVTERSNLPTKRLLAMGRSNLLTAGSNLLTERHKLLMEHRSLLMERLRAMEHHQMEANRRSLARLASRNA